MQALYNIIDTPVESSGKSSEIKKGDYAAVNPFHKRQLYLQ